MKHLLTRISACEKKSKQTVKSQVRKRLQQPQRSSRRRQQLQPTMEGLPENIATVREIYRLA